MIQKEVFSERLKAAMKKQNVKQIDLVRAAQSTGHQTWKKSYKPVCKRKNSSKDGYFIVSGENITGRRRMADWCIGYGI